MWKLARLHRKNNTKGCCTNFVRQPFLIRERLGMPSAIELRHPASASCLGRHLRLAGRCPNNSSLFPPLAAVVVVALWAYSEEELFLFRNSGKSADFPELPFHGRGRGRERQLQTLPSSPSQSPAVTDSPFCRCATSSPGAGEVFPQRESLWHNGTVSGQSAKFAATPEAPSPRELAKPSGFD